MLHSIRANRNDVNTTSMTNIFSGKYVTRLPTLNIKQYTRDHIDNSLATSQQPRHTSYLEMLVMQLGQPQPRLSKI